MRSFAFLFLITFAASAASHAQTADPYETAINAAIDVISPSLVRVETLGGLDKVGAVNIGTGPTTGLIVSTDGYVISSAFNFSQKPTQILVYLKDGSRHPAKLVATDFNDRLVLLKIDAQNLTVPKAAKIADLRVGQTTLALGRAFESEKPNLSVGILSAVNRIWGKAVQTDAKISSNNYGGPLIDLRGDVIGVLAPLSPQPGGEDAGVEWYDSGIGFAVPLETVNRILPRLREGEDLHPGLLGISLRGNDVYGDPAAIASVQPNTPAAEAGWKAGDVIVDVAGKPISRQAELKHALGPRFAGDTVKITVKRGKDLIVKDLPLIAKLAAYQHPFLGILPLREGDETESLGVRGTYPDGPAAKAGLKAGDKIVAADEKVVRNRNDLKEHLDTLAPNRETKLKIKRDGKEQTLTIKLGKLPEGVPVDPAPGRGAIPASEDETPPTGKITIKIPEVKNECVLYVPETYKPGVEHGLVIWLPAPGTIKDDEILAQWKDLASKYDLLVLIPKSSDTTKWDKAELEFLRKAANDALSKYDVDRARIAVAGRDGGGAMAWLMAFQQRDLIRGVLAIDAPLPGGMKPPANEPVNRLAVLVAAPDQGPFGLKYGQLIKTLQDLMYPVGAIPLGATGRPLDPAELTVFARWIDSLDRL